MLYSFYPDEYMSFAMTGKSNYQDGNKFGSTFELVSILFDEDYFPEYYNIKMEVDFKDNLPNHLKANSEIGYVTFIMNSSSELNISYSANEVNKPSDTGYELTDLTPDISIFDAILFGGD